MSIAVIIHEICNRFLLTFGFLFDTEGTVQVDLLAALVVFALEEVEEVARLALRGKDSLIHLEALVYVFFLGVGVGVPMGK
jgi:hypothetical protein